VLRVAAWISVVLGAYGVLAAASLWGLLAGALSGTLGVLIAAAVLTDPADSRTRRVAKIGLGLSGLAFAASAVVLLVIVVSEL
jgi:hypothetical protein